MIVKFRKNWKNQKSFKIWFLLLIWSFISLFLYHVTSLIPNFYVKDLEHPQEFWQIGHYMYYEGSFHSNFFAFLISLLTILSIFKKNCIHVQRFKIVTFSILSTVFLVFWFYLFILRIESTGYTFFLFLTTFIIHAIVPLLYIFVYIYEIKKEKIVVNLNNKKDFLLISIYPFLYIIFAMIIYRAYGAEPEDAIYQFLDYRNQSIAISVATIFGTIFIFLVIAFITINITNKISKNNFKSKDLKK